MTENKFTRAITELNEMRNVSILDPIIMKKEIRKVYEKYGIAKPHLESVKLEFNGTFLRVSSVNNIIDKHAKFLKSENKREMLEEKQHEKEHEQGRDHEPINLSISLDLPEDFIESLKQIENPQECRQVLQQEIASQLLDQNISPDILNKPCKEVILNNFFLPNTKTKMPENATLLEGLTEVCMQSYFGIENEKSQNTQNNSQPNNAEQEDNFEQKKQNNQENTNQEDLTVDNVVEYYLKNGNITIAQEAYLKTQDINGLEDLKGMIPPSMLPPELSKSDININ